MKEKILNIILSKRFIGFILSLIIFIIVLIFTEHKPIEIATSLTLIGGTYMVNETIRKSEKK